MFFVAAGYISLDTHECKSLKETRSIIKSIIERSRAKFKNVSISQVGDANHYKISTVGLSYVSNESDHSEKVIKKVMDFIEEYSFRKILESNFEVLSF